MRQQARKAIVSFQARRHLLPTCGATARSTGDPCRNLALENGRCRYHGGRTPKGDNWHRPSWPNGSRPDAGAKLQAKLRDLDRARKKRDQRLARMTGPEREQYEAWARSHQPGPAAARAAAKVRRQQDRQAATLLAAGLTTKPDSPELAAIKSRLASVQLEIAEMQQALAEQREFDEGIFG